MPVDMKEKLFTILIAIAIVLGTLSVVAMTIFAFQLMGFGGRLVAFIIAIIIMVIITYYILRNG